MGIRTPRCQLWVDTHIDFYRICIFMHNYCSRNNKAVQPLTRVQSKNLRWTWKVVCYTPSIRDRSTRRQSIIEGTKNLFRPIMLTSVTTFLAFTPLIPEPAIQAQFMVPFAASLGIGIMITTLLLMLFLPALMAIFPRVNSSRISEEAP